MRRKLILIAAWLWVKMVKQFACIHSAARLVTPSNIRLITVAIQRDLMYLIAKIWIKARKILPASTIKLAVFERNIQRVLALVIVIMMVAILLPGAVYTQTNHADSMAPGTQYTTFEPRSTTDFF
jgi:hypothetical protein